MDYRAEWHIERQKEYNFPDDCDFDIPAYHVDCDGIFDPRGRVKIKWDDFPIDCTAPCNMPCIPTWRVDDTSKTLEDLAEEATMGLEEKYEINAIVYDGVEIFNFKKKFTPKEVIFNNPATIVYWEDGTKTVVTDTDNVVDGKARPAESYSKETGLALCYMKKALGNKGNYNNAFRKWIKED